MLFEMPTYQQVCPFSLLARIQMIDFLFNRLNRPNLLDLEPNLRLARLKRGFETTYRHLLIILR
jgi:hypothetical protein